jgi:hypothetical protein
MRFQADGTIVLPPKRIATMPTVFFRFLAKRERGTRTEPLGLPQETAQPYKALADQGKTPAVLKVGAVSVEQDQ